jgi:cytoskeletal protein RodZ
MKFLKKEKKIEIDFEQERQEKLTKIGLCLREFREHKNLSVEFISHQIYIPMRLIEAMETGDLKELPEPIYTRELLRKYANYLGLKGDDFANHFNIQQVSKNNQKNHKLNFSFNLSQLKLNPVSLYFVYIILMLVSVKSLADFLKTSPLSNSNIPQIETNIEKNKIEVTSPSTSLNQAPPETIPVMDNRKDLAPKPKEVMVDVTVQDECWIKVTIDGKSEFEGILNKGDKKQWKAKQKLTIRAGNAGGLLVVFNEEKPKTLGKVGQVAEMTFELPSYS